MRIFVVLFVFFFSSLQAELSYINVTSTKNPYKLRGIKHKLNALGLSMFYRKINNLYVVYSGPYKRPEYPLRKVKFYFQNAYIINSRSSSSKKEDTTESYISNIGKKYFVLASLSYSSAPSNHTIEAGTVKIIDPKNGGISYKLEAGLKLKYRFDILGGFMILDSDDLVFTNFYTALNYNLKPYKNITPYVGVIVGYSSLKWNTDPIPNAANGSNNDSTSPFYGTQVGASYRIDKNIDIVGSYDCFFMHHVTNIEIDANNKSKLEHNILHSVNVGIRYNF